ncbi:MAG: hypothetical protein V8S98_08955 [Lachnospiraceae bacterium]
MALTIQERLKDLRVERGLTEEEKQWLIRIVQKSESHEKLCAATGKTEIASDNREIAR